MPKKPTAKNKKTKTSAPKAVTTKDIQEKAYFIWANKGYPENTMMDNWLEAESQLCS
jgi:hypothetical protein